MTDKNSQLKQDLPIILRHVIGAWDGWRLAALCVALAVIAPILSVIWIAFHPTEQIWSHMMATVLPRYFWQTIRLMVFVAVIAGFAGAGTAWLVTFYHFRGSRVLGVILLFPMAIPAYVGAYALVDFLDYSGLVQTLLRETFGWADARDYWFFDIRSDWACAVVLAAAQYPYVYLLARAALREQAGAALEVGRSLGLGPFALFWRLGVPMMRPALAAGIALVMMETVADFGTVQHFGVQTLTTGVFSVWLGQGNAGGAAQIACVILALIALLLGFEAISRRGAKFHNRTLRPITQRPLSGWRGALALGLGLVPFLVGFALPVGVMLGLSLSSPAVWAKDGLAQAALNTALVGGTAAVLTVMAAVILVFGIRMSRSGQIVQALLPITSLGYAAPGAVLALGLLIPLAVLDQTLADTVLALTGYDPGLLITGTSAAVVLAYALRFFGIAQGAIDSAFGRLSPNLPLAARSLGRTPWGTMRAVHLPLMRGSIASALLVVFVDCVKELPATLMLRPFNFNTLSTRVYELASLEHLSEAAPAALIVMAMGLAATLLLARNQ